MVELGCALSSPCQAGYRGVTHPKDEAVSRGQKDNAFWWLVMAVMAEMEKCELICVHFRAYWVSSRLDLCVAYVWMKCVSFVI